MSDIIGKMATVLNGEDAGKLGVIYKVYTLDGVVSIALKYGDHEYGLYNKDDLELV